jgi:hypothetical protein
MFIIEIIASSRTEQEQGCGNDMTVLVGELCKKDKAKKNKCFRRKAEKEKEKTKGKKKKRKYSISRSKRVRLDPFLLPPATVVSFVRLQPTLLTLA